MKILCSNNISGFNFSANNNNIDKNRSTQKLDRKNKIVLYTAAGVGGAGVLFAIFKKKLPASIKKFFNKLFNTLDDCI